MTGYKRNNSFSPMIAQESQPENYDSSFMERSQILRASWADNGQKT